MLPYQVSESAWRKVTFVDISVKRARESVLLKVENRSLISLLRTL
jgi:hypothetical protein